MCCSSLNPRGSDANTKQHEGTVRNYRVRFNLLAHCSRYPGRIRLLWTPRGIMLYVVLTLLLYFMCTTVQQSPRCHSFAIHSSMSPTKFIRIKQQVLQETHGVLVCFARRVSCLAVSFRTVHDARQENSTDCAYCRWLDEIIRHPYGQQQQRSNNDDDDDDVFNRFFFRSSSSPPLSHHTMWMTIIEAIKQTAKTLLAGLLRHKDADTTRGRKFFWDYCTAGFRVSSYISVTSGRSMTQNRGLCLHGDVLPSTVVFTWRRTLVRTQI